jgi:hypothetical protein
MMEQNLEYTVALLERTPAALDVLLRGLPEAWTLSNEGDSSWNCYTVVGHLIHAEIDDWIPRARQIVESTQLQTFAPFDREGHDRHVAGKSMEELLDEFARLRKVSLTELSGLNLKPEDLKRRGRHPALGEVTLSELLATWAAHDMTHLHQISRIMAYQYKEAVGPWARFLGVMQCAGHSAAA